MNSFVKPQDIPLEAGGISVMELKLFINREAPVILDVGANVGQTTEEFLRRMPSAKVFSFEPDPRAIQKFKSRISSPNVKLFECAVGNQSGTVTFNQSTSDGNVKDWDQSGSIRQPKKHLEVWPWVKFEKQIEVPIVRLDDWIKDKDIESVDLIWADAQGAEGDLIAGGSEVLKRTRFLYTEYGVSEWYEGQISLDAMCAMLAERGFALCRKFEMDALFVNKNANDLGNVDLPIRRNAPCPCGSNKKYKHCHGSLM